MGIVTVLFVTQAWFAVETYQGTEPKDLFKNSVAEYNFND